MASTDRKTTRNIETLIEELSAKPHEFDFYHVLRLIECFYPNKPRLGESKKPSDDPVRLSQDPALTFEASSLTGFIPGTDGGTHHLKVRLFGLLGPNGPLPLHFTEYVRHRRRDYGDSTFESFLNLFHHRMLSLFYRAWANNEPTVSYDRPDWDRFANYVAAVIGIGMSPLRKRDEISDLSKFYFSGRLSCQTRCAEGLQDILSDYFNLPVFVETFVGEWMTLPKKHVCRLGRDRQSGTLGQTFMLGLRTWNCQHKFRIRIGPLKIGDYISLLPAGGRIRRLVTLVRNYIGDELAWDLKLILKREEVPCMRLDNRSRLGWTTWLGNRGLENDAEDFVFNPFVSAVKAT